MFNTLFSLFHTKDALSRIRDISCSLIDILEHFEADKLKEGGDAKNAAIDALVEILQAHKDPINTITSSVPKSDSK